VRDEQAALDVVQDAMLRLAESYGERPGTELPLLFQRILQNAIRDWPGSRDEDRDPLETLAEAGDSNAVELPPDRLERTQLLEIIEQEIVKLPARQREAFLMRYWEELDVAETARAMGCSEGSVKTHCSRAAHALAAALKARGVGL